MGNRAVITTKENWKHDGVGIYLHWNGGRDSVEGFLKYCELKGYRSPSNDCYGWARLAQVIGNFLGGALSVGIDTIWHLDRDNGDNGVYIIDGWKIADRYYFDGHEQESYSLEEMLLAIDESMPEEEQLGEEFLKAEEFEIKDLDIGDTVFYASYGEKKFSKYQIIAVKVEHDLQGNELRYPVMNCYGSTFEENLNNPNNLLKRGTYRAIKGGLKDERFKE